MGFFSDGAPTRRAEVSRTPFEAWLVVACYSTPPRVRRHGWFSDLGLAAARAKRVQAIGLGHRWRYGF